jgi:hypothetical protein
MAADESADTCRQRTTDVLARVLDPLWSAAVAAARDEQAEADAAERAALVQAEATSCVAGATADVDRAWLAVHQISRNGGSWDCAPEAPTHQADNLLKMSR